MYAGLFDDCIVYAAIVYAAIWQLLCMQLFELLCMQGYLTIAIMSSLGSLMFACLCLWGSFTYVNICT